ncbi:MAG: MAPEG family protein [Georgfuchsia sp.]
MTPTLYYVIYAGALTMLALLMGSVFRNRLWTLQGFKIGIGNRDSVPPPTPLSGRADRAAMNTLENFVLFAALAITAHVAGMDNEQVALGAGIFFWARVAYLLIYLLGIVYLRTLVWAVGLAGMVMIAAALF